MVVWLGVAHGGGDVPGRGGGWPGPGWRLGVVMAQIGLESAVPPFSGVAQTLPMKPVFRGPYRAWVAGKSPPLPPFFRQRCENAVRGSPLCNQGDPLLFQMFFGNLHLLLLMMHAVT